MLVCAVIGLKGSGKTTCVEALVREFAARGLKVGTVKSMLHSTLTLDTDGKDTRRHARAGAGFVIALSRSEMAYMEKRECASRLDDFLHLVPPDTGILVCEGLADTDPRIVRILTASRPDEVDAALRTRGFRPEQVAAFSGRMAVDSGEHMGKPVIDCTRPEGARMLADIVLDMGMPVNKE